MKNLHVSLSALRQSLLIGGAGMLVALSASALEIGPTVDIGEFLPLEPGTSWNMTGTATYSFLSFNVDIVVTTEAGGNMHGKSTSLIKLEANGSSFGQTARVIQEIQVSLDINNLYLHSRVGRVYFNGELDDEDIEVYLAPARILPRLITVGRRYPFTTESNRGNVEDSIVLESIESISTALGTVETIKLMAFTQDDVPVTLWLGRDVGYMKARVSTEANDLPLTVQATLTDTNCPWNPTEIEALWAETVNNGGGWRYAEWLGHFWAANAHSPWINHLGFRWAYCLGNAESLWVYLPGNGGWVWTSEGFYPAFYNSVNGHYLNYVLFPGSAWFWDWSTFGWVNLGI